MAHKNLHTNQQNEHTTDLINELYVFCLIAEKMQ